MKHLTIDLNDLKLLNNVLFCGKSLMTGTVRCILHIKTKIAQFSVHCCYVIPNAIIIEACQDMRKKAAEIYINA